MNLFGPAVMGLGVILTGIGLFSYFASRSKFQIPNHLWCVMVGVPLIGIGASLTNLGHHEEILRELEEEVSPAALAPLIEAKRRGTEARPHLPESGLSTATNGDLPEESAIVLCGRCEASNPADARFCNQCGTSLLTQKCPECGAMLTPVARFCNQCGVPVS